MHASDRLAALRVLIGNTPLLEIDVELSGRKRTVWAKAENLNLTGSIKDRMAYHVLRSAYDRGLLRPGATIIEATSGNTGISFAALGRALGHPVVIFMPDWMTKERQNLLRSFGAELRLVSHADGGFVGSIRMAEQLADYLHEMGVRVSYLHSEVDTLERVQILRDLRLVVPSDGVASNETCDRDAALALMRRVLRAETPKVAEVDFTALARR